MALCSALLVPPASAQSAARVARDTRILKAPGSQSLGTLLAGAEVTTGKTSGSAVEVTFEGWIISSSLGPFSREGFDAVVTGRPSENLRAEPNGTILARLATGVGLVKLDTRGGWTRVRRVAWVDHRAVPAPAAPAAASAGPDRGVVARRTPLTLTPGGESVGAADSGLSVRIIARSGGWSRVQLETWVPDSALNLAPAGVLVGVSQAEVRADPARYIGQIVEWRLQFVAVQKADELRPEIPEGTSYLLTRGPLPEPGFVYVMVPPDKLPQFESLPPLKELVIRGTVRAATTKYLPTPVLELVAVVEGAGS